MLLHITTQIEKEAGQQVISDFRYFDYVQVVTVDILHICKHLKYLHPIVCVPGNCFPPYGQTLNAIDPQDWPWPPTHTRRYQTKAAIFTQFPE